MVISPAEQLLRDAEAQESAHRKLVDAYSDLIQLTRDGGLRLLLEILRADAERDRRLLARAAGSLRNSIFWLREPDPLPPVGQQPERAEAIRLLADVLRLNRERARSLAGFRSAAHHLYDGLLEGLAAFAAADADKHVRLLAYAAERVEPREVSAEQRPDRDDGHLRLIIEEVAFEAALADV